MKPFRYIAYITLYTLSIPFMMIGFGLLYLAEYIKDEN